MSENYTLIASREPYTHAGTRRCYELAVQLSRCGHRVTLFLVQNGVLPARSSRAAVPLEGVIGSRVRVVAEDFSLRERGISREQLPTGIEIASLELVLDELASGAHVIWH